MKTETRDLIKAERRRSDFGFITEIVQRGRIKPAKFIHSITMPADLYEEMSSRNVINLEDHFIDDSVFFEHKGDKVILSFKNLYHAEDMHRRIDHWLVIMVMGTYPIERTGVSKMNFDKHVEAVQHVLISPLKKNIIPPDQNHEDEWYGDVFYSESLITI